MAKRKRAKPAAVLTPPLQYLAGGAGIQVEAYKEKWRREWERRIGTEFPGFELEALERVAAAAEIPFDRYGDFTAGEIYRLAIEVLDPQRRQAPPAIAKPDVRLSPAEQDLVDVVREAGGTVGSQTEIFNALSAKGKIPSEGTTKTMLAAMVRHGVLQAGPGGKGYKLP